MFQRAAKTHNASPSDSDKISLKALVDFCKNARIDLNKVGEEDAALRFEILEDWLRNDFKGSLKYNSKMIGL
jgi:hypothetical protein